jgi:hypothetical protein
MRRKGNGETESDEVERSRVGKKEWDGGESRGWRRKELVKWEMRGMRGQAGYEGKEEG